MFYAPRLLSGLYEHRRQKNDFSFDIPSEIIIRTTITWKMMVFMIFISTENAPRQRNLCTHPRKKL